MRDDELWLSDAAAMADDFMATPAVEHLAQGRLGMLPKTPKLGRAHMGWSYSSLSRRCTDRAALCTSGSLRLGADLVRNLSEAIS